MKKKGLYRLIAVYLSIALLLPSLLLPELFVGAASGSYEGTVWTFKAGSKNESAMGMTRELECNELTPDIFGTHVGITWTGGSVRDNTSAYWYLATVNSDTTTDTYEITEDSAFMFYVKLPEASPENKIFVHITTSTRGDAETYGARQNIGAAEGAPIYYLQRGATEWEMREAPAYSNAKGKGSLVFTPGFEGWVRMPLSSMFYDEAASMHVYRLWFYPDRLGGDYTDGGIEISTFMLVSDGDAGYTDVTVDGKTSSLLNELAPHHTTHLLNVSSATGAKASENETVVESGYTYALSGTEANLKFTGESAAALQRNGSMLLYARLPDEGDNGLNIAVNGTAGLKPGDTVYVLDRGEKEFEEVTVGSGGNLPLKGGFEGWLLLPADAFDGAAGKTVNSLAVTSKREGAYIGTAMLSDTAEPIYAILMDDAVAPILILLTKTAYYRGTLLDAEDAADDTLAGDYYSVSDRQNDSTFSTGVDGGYYYEVGVGSAAEGEYKVEGEKPLPYTGHSTGNMTSASNNGIRPTGGAAGIVGSALGNVTSPFTSQSVTISAASITDTSAYWQNGVYDFRRADFTTSAASFYTSTFTADYTLGNGWTPDGAMVFYVEYTGTVDTWISLGNQITPQGGSGTWGYLFRDKPYYLLADGTAEWVAGTTAEFIPIGGGAESAKTGYASLTIPAGFKGWVRIPTDAIRNPGGKKWAELPSGAITSFRFYPGALGGDYGAITLSRIVLVDEGSRDNYSVAIDGDAAASLMADGVSAPAMTYDVVIGNVDGLKTFTTNAPIGYLYSVISLKSAATLRTDDALMFFAEHNGRVASTLRIDFGDTGLGLAAGAPYALYNSADEYWEYFTAGDSGRITIPDGFSSWVRIPYASITDGNSENPAGGLSFSSMHITPYELGGPYGKVRIGSFMIVNHGASDLNTMCVDGGDETGLSSLKAYTGLIPEFGEILPGGASTRTVKVAEATSRRLVGTRLYTFANELELAMDADNGMEFVLYVEEATEKYDGILLYVKLPEGTENSLFLGGSLAAVSGAAYYTLGAGTDSVWTAGTITQNGAMALETGFEGYVRVPFTSIKDVPATLESFVLAFAHVGGSYGEPVFGEMMLIDKAAYNYTDIYTIAVTYAQSLKIDDYSIGYLLQGTYDHADDAAGVLTTAQLDGNPLTPQINRGYAYSVSVTGDPLVLEGSAATPRTKFTVNDIYQARMSESGGLLFYVNLPKGVENRLFVQGVADISAATFVGAPYALLAEGDAYWTAKNANGYGEVTFPAGFKGWVHVPYSSMKNSKNEYLQTQLTAINFSFRRVGGEYGSPQIGTIIVLENSGKLQYLQLEGTEGKINLFGTRQPDTRESDEIAIWTSVLGVFEGWKEGEAPHATTVTNAEIESEATSTFTQRIVYGMTPFAARGLEYASTNAVAATATPTPRVQLEVEQSCEGAEGLVFYIEIPDNGKEKNPFWIQLSTIDSKSLTINVDLMTWTLEKGTSDWKNVLHSAQRNIGLPSGWKGYIYVPLSSFVMLKNDARTGVPYALQQTDVIRRVNIAFGEYGGEYGEGYVGGMFLSNGVLSHDGAYVDGDLVCRNVFTGEAVNEADVRYDPYDTPANSGDAVVAPPDATTDIYLAYKEGTTSHSAKVAWDYYPGADRYRVDVYKFGAFPYYGFGLVYYTYVYSVWSTENVVELSSLATSSFYTVVVNAFKGDTGLAVYPAVSVVPEPVIVGDMLSVKEDPYRYEWFTDLDDDDEEWIEEEIFIPGSGGGTSGHTVIKKVRRRRVGGGMEPWLIAVIVAAGVIGAAAITLVIIIIVRKRRKKQEQPIAGPPSAAG